MTLPAELTALDWFIFGFAAVAIVGILLDSKIDNDRRAARAALSHLHSMLAAGPLFPRDSAAFVEVAASLPQVRRLATMPCPLPSH